MAIPITLSKLKRKYMMHKKYFLKNHIADAMFLSLMYVKVD